MKKIIFVLLLCFLLIGCGEDGNESVSPEEGQELIDKASAILEEAYSMDGFMAAGMNYEKYNSYASENGLGGTLVYIDGKVLNQQDVSTEDMLMLNLIVEQKDGNRWSVAIAYLNNLEDIVGKEVRAFGTYNGFSDKFNVPGMVVVDDEAKSKIQIKNESGIYETIWSFQDYVLEYLKEKESESASEEVKKGENNQQIDSKYNPTMGDRNALKKAKSYLEIMTFSYNGLVEQLEYEKFSHEEAVYAADNCGVDWNEQARIKAKSYLDMMAFSKDGLIEQLEYEGFSHEQAVYGAEQNGY